MRLSQWIVAVFLLLSWVNANGADEADKMEKEQDKARRITAIPGAVWATFNFNDGLSPSGGQQKMRILSEFHRATPLILPGYPEFAKNTPCLVQGREGKGLYLGVSAKNLLPAGLSMMDLDPDTLKSIQVLESVQVRIDRSGKEALFGTTSLAVETGERIQGGVSIPLPIPGGKYEKSADHVYVFSVYLKGRGKVQVDMTIADGRCDFPKSLNLTDEWQRLTLWVSSPKATLAHVSFRNFTGNDTRFFLDGLQLEWKADVDARITRKRHETPSGMEFSASPWLKGGDTETAGQWMLQWTGNYAFPIEEGSVNFWIRPAFYRMDAEDHAVFSMGDHFYSLLFARNNTVQFFRKNDEDSLEAARPETMAMGKWSMITIVWSNEKKEIRLYFNGKKIAVRQSDRFLIEKDDLTPDQQEADAANPKRIRVGSGKTVDMGGFQGPSAGLNAVLDDVSIYSTALDDDQVFSLMPVEEE